MNLETIACNQCGAPLAIPDAANFATCNHCHANLAVRRNDSVKYTEIVEKIAEQTANFAEQLAHLRYQNELERIDREWQNERESLLITDKQAVRHETDSGAAMIGFGLAIAFGVLWTAVASSMSPPFALFGILFIGAAVAGMLSVQRKAGAFKQAHAAYRTRKSRISAADFLAGSEIDHDRQRADATNLHQPTISVDHEHT